MTSTNLKIQISIPISTCSKTSKHYVVRHTKYDNLVQIKIAIVAWADLCDCFIDGAALTRSKWQLRPNLV